jgi:hypothetical protein
MTTLQIINNSISQTINENSIENLERIGTPHDKAVHMVTEYSDLDLLANSIDEESILF